ncbi:MAG: capsular polysaccharide biosynthesis protein [Sediminimonas sp.]|uniref:capsular polysaccharide biosynthesis protein n=1 Tax=Sediminimonas sp. TaxID=2823379 RepID=UPI00286FD532|nr:capsular polysaccharide biosynthesis protein [Sediminimonas sp.]MDR9483653.1 capsular polysaccharide biosynthesis protein [Sediminimonas sp.]
MARAADIGTTARRLCHLSGGFLRQRRLRRILQLAGYELRLGWPRAGDQVAVWGHAPRARRGEWLASRTGAGLLRIEDAFLRSVHPGRARGGPPIGLLLDECAMHYDPARPSRLERILAEDPLDDTALLNRARGAIARLREADLSKYNAHDPDLSPPPPGYVLVIDQTRDDAAVRIGGSDANTFREMLYHAQADHPGTAIVIKTHPDTASGARAGYFAAQSAEADPDRITLCTAPVSPHALLEGAVAVYTVSSQMGFEAIMAGHRPHVFGQPFYAGWGLSHDARPITRRQRSLTRTQLFAAAMILYPIWYDPCRDRLCTLEQAIDQLDAETRAWREDRRGWHARGMRLWKRGALNRFFGRYRAVRFDQGKGAPKDGRRLMTWAGHAAPGDGAVRVEDGFLRSSGLGAELVAPLSLVCDDLGIYYDPARESRLERLIAARAVLRPDQQTRAETLVAALRSGGVSKYNLQGAALPPLPDGRRILVAGQVEDDASIRAGATGAVRTNHDLLRAARAANPDAVILYKPHPDVEAGLRRGALPPDAAAGLADMVLHHADPVALLPEVQGLWTMTSLLGFEALLRGVPVTTLGAPFYAGWGLTDHRGPALPRRTARPGLAGLAHATLIDYPRYMDPLTGLPCPAEVIAERLRDRVHARGGLGVRLLAKAQGALASQAHLWR